MVGWHHQLNGHESEPTPGDSEAEGSLACCSPWGSQSVRHHLGTEQQQATSWILRSEPPLGFFLGRRVQPPSQDVFLDTGGKPVHAPLPIPFLSERPLPETQLWEERATGAPRATTGPPQARAQGQGGGSAGAHVSTYVRRVRAYVRTLLGLSRSDVRKGVCMQAGAERIYENKREEVSVHIEKEM